jgi:hypothetical protein
MPQLLFYLQVDKNTILKKEVVEDTTKSEEVQEAGLSEGQATEEKAKYIVDNLKDEVRTMI